MSNKISVCLATFNGEKYIKAQLDSILSQLSENDEVIVSDDGSIDNTLPILRNYNDYRIKIYNNSKRKGVIGNFENALYQAQGDYLFLCDQDDIWMPDKVEKMTLYLEKNDLVVSDCSIINENEAVICKSFFDKHGSGSGFWKNLNRNTYLGCCIAFRSNLKNIILPFPPNIAMHDIWIGLNADLNGSVYFLPEQLLLYRRHGNNASSSSEKSKFSLTYKILYRIQMLYNILIRKYID